MSLNPVTSTANTCPPEKSVEIQNTLVYTHMDDLRRLLEEAATIIVLIGDHSEGHNMEADHEILCELASINQNLATENEPSLNPNTPGFIADLETRILAKALLVQKLAYEVSYEEDYYFEDIEPITLLLTQLERLRDRFLAVSREEDEDEKDPPQTTELPAVETDVVEKNKGLTEKLNGLIRISNNTLEYLKVSERIYSYSFEELVVLLNDINSLLGLEAFFTRTRKEKQNKHGENGRNSLDIIYRRDLIQTIKNLNSDSEVIVRGLIGDMDEIYKKYPLPPQGAHEFEGGDILTLLQLIKLIEKEFELKGIFLPKHNQLLKSVLEEQARAVRNKLEDMQIAGQGLPRDLKELERLLNQQNEATKLICHIEEGFY
ncbi:hypothetical protein HOE67_00205 [Candidatus Peregrinibacteria bacterium]|jgi:hypothetical protein|nr:hypothetical protein [Candidatus Peregrinibacteria bacterium]MBT4055515.1 hypothetical protein [Candidatus Peregrinibacteria bacterium]